MSETQTVENTNQEVVAQKVETVEVQSKEESQGLTKKDIKYREEYKKTVSELEELKVLAESRLAEMSQKLEASEKTRQMSDQKRIEAEVKAIAVAEGLVDSDLIQLMDKSKITLSETGELMGARELVAEFKQNKPAFFSQTKKISSSTNYDAGSKIAAPVVSNVFDIPDDQFKKMLSNIPHSF